MKSATVEFIFRHSSCSGSCPSGVILSAMPALQLKQKQHGGVAIAEHDRIRQSRHRGPDNTSADSEPLSRSRPMTACLTDNLADSPRRSASKGRVKDFRSYREPWKSRHHGAHSG